MNASRWGRWANPGICVLSLLLTASCSKKPAQPGSIESPFLSPKQKDILRELHKRSPKGITVEVWPRGGTVAGLDLEVPSGLARTVPPAEHALAFVKQNAPLWQINSGQQLHVASVQEGAGCVSVTLQLVHASGLPVFNAVLSVGVTPEGMIRGAIGKLSGEEFSLPRAAQRLSATHAKRILLRQLGEPNLELPEPTRMIVDPFFLSDGKHVASTGWVFSAPSTVTNPAGPFVVNEETETVTVSGLPTVPNPSGTSGCPAGNPVTPLPEVVVDPMTGTPAFVGMRHFGGLRTQGATPVDRAYNALSNEMLARMYGTLNPRKHLQQAKVIPSFKGRVNVRFQEYFDGIPVEGAHLAVVLDPGGNASAVHARFVYRPLAPRVPTISANQAIQQALPKFLDLECGDDQACRRRLAPAKGASEPPTSLVILSSLIFRGTTIPPGQARLAWKIIFPMRTIYWDATAPGRFLLDFPTIFTHIPYEVRNFALNNQVEMTGPPRQRVLNTPYPDAEAAAKLMPAIDNFYGQLGWHSYDNTEGLLRVRVKWDEENSAWCSPERIQGSCSEAASGIRLGEGFVQGDVFAHEFTHGVTAFSAALVYGDEPGALNESYSDVMGELIYPDADPTSWLQGEDVPTIGPFRDMKNPGAKGHPGHVGLMNDSCMSRDKCVHEWSGVPNHAAVFISDGGIPGVVHPGVGRPKLARLYFDSLTGGMLGSSDRFLNQRLVTTSVCQDLVSASPLLSGLTFTPADCDHVGNSFDAVGLNVTPVYGWSRFSTGLFGTKYDRTEFAGLHLFRGCTIRDQTLRAQDENGAVQASNIAQGLSVDMGGWGASVTARGAATDPTDRTISYHVWSDWFHTGVVDITEDYNMPAGVTTRAECQSPPPPTPGAPPPHLRTLFSATRVAHWAVFLNGGKGDDPVNASVQMPAGCSISSVVGIHYHGGNAQYPAAISLDDGSHGYTVSRTSTNPGALDATVHWWHNGDSGIFVRVVYNIWEPSGADCSVPGSTQTTP